MTVSDLLKAADGGGTRGVTESLRGVPSAALSVMPFIGRDEDGRGAMVILVIERRDDDPAAEKILAKAICAPDTAIEFATSIQQKAGDVYDLEKEEETAAAGRLPKDAGGTP